MYVFNQNPFTFCGSISPASVSSMNVPFSAAIIQYGPVQRKRSFPGILPMHVWNTGMALPIANSFSFCPRCRSTKALRRCWSSSRTARLWMCVSPRVRSCFRRICSEAPSGIRSFTCMRKLEIWNSTGVTASNPYAKRHGVSYTLGLKFVL